MTTKKTFLIAALVPGICVLPLGHLTAQTFTTLHSFDGSHGDRPYAGLILSGHSLYGTAIGDSGSGMGTVFTLHTEGSGFTNLHNFSFVNFPPVGPATNSDGAFPYAELVLAGDTLFGAASEVGSLGYGTIFKLNTNGTGFTSLYSFTGGSDGAYPYSGLVLTNNTLYGMALNGGVSAQHGTIFKVNTNGTGFTVLHTFAAGSGAFPNITNSDGAFPRVALTLSGNTLYGTAPYGGHSGYGTVFSVNTDGTGFANLHNFTTVSGPAGAAGTNSDGALPRGGLILSGDTLYGTARDGGRWGSGTIFAINTNGTGFTTLYSFTARSGPNFTNNDGALPRAGLILSGNSLYGTASEGGRSGNGTLFVVKTNGAGFTSLHSFAAGFGSFPNSTNSDGIGPYARLILRGATLYGTTLLGGSSGYGTVFSLSFPPPELTITPIGTNVVFVWPANLVGFDYAGYHLQSTMNLVSPVIWSTNSFTPVLVNGRNTVTNPASGPQQFYRLSQ